VGSDSAQPGVLRVLQSKQETKAFYNKISKVYDLLAEHSEAPVRRAGIEMLALQAGEHALEIGVGTGHCLVEMARSVGEQGRVFGIDLSENMLEIASRLLLHEGFESRAELHCGDAIRLPYADAVMDAVFMSFTLELFDTPEIPQVLNECRRVLKPGGRIVVVGMSRDAPDGFILEAFEWTHRHFPNFLDCRPIYVGKAIEAAGFEIVDQMHGKMWVPVEIVCGVKT